ncbi:proline iminopeptidase-family hydrolase [Albidovulum sediminis]|uniref:Proline iminopeptidase-family hydrolase n=1 Tax=Albidovulum sediminis TaxID=3066345 RepID=A0ABT2NKQ0_9RHOB|nr:proline iminopeptidase-family hydrolase [Defluviimonas sediminis]MCT8329500.1 proline iminopeptidase-family hydrolase [Defluviimonas sediminis]
MSWTDPEIAGYVDGPGGRTWFRQNGLAQSRPAIVGITGGPGMSHHYLMPLTALCDRHPVVLYDQLDTGNSDRPGDPANWTIGYFVEEIERVRLALGHGALILAGHSWGGLLAYEYALRHPGSTAGLILVSPCLDAARWSEDARALIAGLPDYAQRLIRECEASDDFANPGYQHANELFMARHLRRKGGRPPHHVRSGELFNQSLYTHIWGPSEFTARGTIRDYDGSPRLAEVSAPVLYVCGEHDEARPATLREFAGRMQDAAVVELPEVAHLSFIEDEPAFLGAVRNFLERRFP